MKFLKQQFPQLELLITFTHVMSYDLKKNFKSTEKTHKIFFKSKKLKLNHNL